MTTTGRNPPKLGVLAINPIQYHTPLFQRLARRGNVALDVLFLTDQGYRPVVDPGFGRAVSWDIDLLSGYAHRFLASLDRPAGAGRRVLRLARWIRSQDVMIINGYDRAPMLLAMALCRSHRIPYLLRGQAHPVGQATGMRRRLRNVGTRLVVSASSGGLSMGHLNEQFYRRKGARLIYFAPNSVDSERFAAPPATTRAELLARLGLSDDRPVIMFCGKLIPRKRPLDLAAAVGRLPGPVTTLFVGDGPLAGRVRAELPPGCGAVTDFVNQAELPSYYHAADVLVLPSEVEPWGLVVNEAMAAGVLPVVSDRVGCGPDLVQGLGEVYPCGDVAGLAAALERALRLARDPATRDRVRRHAARYGIDRTVTGFEAAALAVSNGHRSPGGRSQ
jgi:glycosyltransferase involved in cell wall biosynthesis